MQWLNSKFVSYVLIFLQTILFTAVSVLVPEMNSFPASIKYVIVIIAVLSSVVALLFYRFMIHTCLAICGITELKQKYVFDNVLYLSLILTNIQIFVFTQLKIDTSTIWLKLLNPMLLITLVALAYHLKKIEDQDSKLIGIFLGLLIILHILFQIATHFLGVGAS